MSRKWVWPEVSPRARVTSVYFRREFALTQNVLDAHLHLFVHSRYHLRVNGHRVGVGPARSYPEYPEFDRYDLSPYLQLGENVIAVHVVHVGDESYHQLPLQGAFVAWGAIETEGGDALDLATPGDWVCQRSLARDEMAPRFSFAIGSLDHMDLRKESGNWWQQERPDGEWCSPLVLDEPLPWGELVPRSIPPLTRTFEAVEALLGVYEHDPDGTMLSFRLSPGERLDDPYAFACTSIHSPRDQEVVMGTWWGEYFINGEVVNQVPDPEGRSFRQKAVVSLKVGWNFLCVGYGLLDNIWEFHLAYPHSAGLHMSATQTDEGEPTIHTVGPFSKSALPAMDQSFRPESPSDVIEACGGEWRSQETHTVACSPLRALAWPRFTRTLTVGSHSVSALRASADQSTSFVLDYGCIQLGQIVFTCDAPEGTCIDVGYAEALSGNRPAYGKNHLVMAGERRWCRGGKQEIEFFFPRGFRFVQIAVSQHTADVTIESIGVLRQRYPYDFRADFQCSDTAWTQLWHEGVHTLDLCSEDVITDCPWRERTLYGGDLFVEAATAFAVTGDTALVRRCIEIFVQSYSPETHWLQSMAPKVLRHNKGTLFDYPLLIIHLCWWYYRYSGDLAFVKRCVPVFREMMNSLRGWRKPDGCWQVRDGFAAFLDWVDIDASGNVCALNALIARVCKDWAGLLRVADEDVNESAGFDTLGHETAVLLHQRYWDTDVDAFADCVADDGTREGDHFIVSSSWPSVFGFCDADTNRAIAHHIEARMKTFDPHNDHATSATYGAFYYLGALYQMGEEALAEQCLRTQYQLMIQHSTGTIWEHSHDQKSLAHAWSTSPTYYGSTRVLGVRLGWPEPDALDKILIAPQAASITWARGVVMHPRGPVSVDWRLEAGRMHLSYEAPAGVSVRVEPCGMLAQYPLVVNGAERDLK